MAPMVAETVAEANAQNLHVPEYDLPGLPSFFHFALSVNGYRIAEELGEDAFDILERLQQHYLTTREWRGSLLELRIALFCQARRLHHWGCGADEEGVANESRSLLDAIRNAAAEANASH